MAEAAGFKTTAWNGVCFQAPASWEVLRLGKNYLLLEDRGRPTMEVKWGKIRGRFSADRQLKRLAAASRKAAEPLRCGPVPEHWRSAMGPYEASAFAWADRQVRAQGVLLYCPACSGASMVQFFSPLGSDLTAKILASFRDHADGETAAWQVFDIRARLPRRYALERFRFEPGQYRMVFKAGGQVVTLMRWGPADVLMGSGGLSAFAGDRIGVVGENWREVSLPAGSGLQWLHRAPSAPFWRKLLTPMKVQAACIWHLLKENRILAVTIEARQSVDDRLLSAICSAYAVV
jgi:hypothetical protein